MDHLGVELDAVDAALHRLQRGHRRGGGGRQRHETRRRLEDRVAVRHPAGLLGRQLRQQPAGLAHRQLRAPEFADLGTLHAAAEGTGDQLHPVADAQHRDAELEQGRVQVRRAIRVDRSRPAREDQALRLALGHRLDAGVVGQQLGEHAQLAHPPGDQLGVLAAVVEHHHGLGGDGRHWTFLD